MPLGFNEAKDPSGGRRGDAAAWRSWGWRFPTPTGYITISRQGDRLGVPLGFHSDGLLFQFLEMLRGRLLFLFGPLQHLGRGLGDQ